jgi:hypothetical protein
MSKNIQNVRSLSLWTKIWSCPSLSLARIHWRGTWVVYTISLYVLCVEYCITYVGFIQTLQIHATITLSLSLSLTVVQQTNSVPGRLISEFSVSHTIRHTLDTRTPLQGWSARRRGRCLHNTQHSQQTNIHAISRILTRDPSNQAAADFRLSQRDQRNRPTKVLIVDN